MNRFQRPVFVSLGLICLGVLLTAGEVAGDPPGFGAAAGGQTAVPSNEVTNFTGKLKGFQRGLVIVEKDDGTEAMVMPPDQISSFQFVAKASPAFLQRGMLVRLTGNFGPGGVPLEPIAKITLFQQVDLRSIKGRAKDQFTPGIHGDPKPGNPNQPMTGKLTIVGSLIGVTPNGILALQAGRMPIQVPVNADTELEVRYNNLSLAKEGDKVTVAGFYQAPNENQVKAERITVTTDRVYGEVQPGEQKNSRRKRGEKKTEPVDEAKPDNTAGSGKPGADPDQAAEADDEAGL
ncbi:hypothetical protein NHH03_01760 [Stieleria sp. TO1_6]|uniref:hypothetical protein n=1 Tax=Stieleria tagensis TaxID=2956795 RepID=UPI00209B6F94|nr:hypothetical protein [Stieleria tagensis]MCO8120446.1 hypothetical protein [Stieleria tagensis]